MDNKGVAHQRKNHVLSESSKRLKNLVKGDHGEDAEEELKHPTGFHKSKKASPRSVSPRKGDNTKKVEPKEEVVKEGDPSTVRFLGYLQLHLFVFAFVLGSFVCYHRHHRDLKDHYPRFFMNVFAFLNKKGVHNLADLAFRVWKAFPEHKRKTFVKYMGYGTVFLNLYPVLSGPAKKKPGEEVVVEVDPQSEFQNKLNKHVVKVGSSLFRLLSATVLCGLLGYDLAYNLHYVKRFFSKLLGK